MPDRSALRLSCFFSWTTRRFVKEATHCAADAEDLWPDVGVVGHRDVLHDVGQTQPDRRPEDDAWEEGGERAHVVKSATAEQNWTVPALAANTRGKEERGINANTQPEQETGKLVCV